MTDLRIRCGRKFGRPYGVVRMEKIIGEHEEKQTPIRKYSECK